MNLGTLNTLALIAIYLTTIVCAIYVIGVVGKDIGQRIRTEDTNETKVCELRTYPVADAEHMLSRNEGWEYVRYSKQGDKMVIRREIEI